MSLHVLQPSRHVADRTLQISDVMRRVGQRRQMMGECIVAVGSCSGYSFVGLNHEAVLHSVAHAADASGVRVALAAVVLKP